VLDSFLNAVFMYAVSTYPKIDGSTSRNDAFILRSYNIEGDLAYLPVSHCGKSQFDALQLSDSHPIFKHIFP
jgi:hypothetical protein